MLRGSLGAYEPCRMSEPMACIHLKTTQPATGLQEIIAECLVTCASISSRKIPQCISVKLMYQSNYIHPRIFCCHLHPIYKYSIVKSSVTVFIARDDSDERADVYNKQESFDCQPKLNGAKESKLIGMLRYCQEISIARQYPSPIWTLKGNKFDKNSIDSSTITKHISIPFTSILQR